MNACKKLYFLTRRACFAYPRLAVWKFCRNTPSFPRVKVLSVTKLGESYEIRYLTYKSHTENDDFRFDFLSCLYARLFYRRERKTIKIRPEIPIRAHTVLSLLVQAIQFNRAEKNSIAEYDPYLRQFALTEKFISPKGYAEHEEALKKTLLKQEKDNLPDEDPELMRKFEEQWANDSSHTYRLRPAIA